MTTYQGSSSTEADRLQYSRELAAYTLRQFSQAHLSVSKDEFAAAKVPPSISRRIESILKFKSSSSSSPASPRHSPRHT